MLAALNETFQMERHSDKFFTIWYGVYQASTRTLRYASAGAPPAFAFDARDDGTVSITDLSTVATPIGMFVDTEFSSGSYVVRPGCQILVYSDGAHEITLADGRQFSVSDFRNLNARLAAASSWSLDSVLVELQMLTPRGAFEDDCSLIELTFD